MDQILAVGTTQKIGIHHGLLQASIGSSHLLGGLVALEVLRLKKVKRKFTVRTPFFRI
jgi:hypothetical protein